MATTKRELEQLPDERAPESVRVLIPRIASAMIYDPRSKKGAIHVKPIDPNYMDATLAVSGCDWVLAEFLRTYHVRESEELQGVIGSLVMRKVPYVERHGDRSFVTVHLGAEDEILLLLLDSSQGVGRSSIGKSLGNTYTQGRITQALQALVKKRFAVKTSGGYAITGPGEAHISEVISRVQAKQGS